MSSVGIDIGNLGTVMSIAQRRGIDTIVNELSNRNTPSIISFGSEKRCIGEEGKSQEVRNLKNTVSSIKMLQAGLIEKGEEYEIVIDKETGLYGARITHQGKERIFTSTQLQGMLLGHLKKTIVEYSGSEPLCPIIAVPTYFTQQQRMTMLEAAKIAGLEDASLITEPMALVYCYGTIRADTLSEEPHNICFIDIGHTSAQICIAKMTKTSAEIVGTDYSLEVGGKYFDAKMVEYYIEEIKKKRGIDISTNKRALHRLRTSCEKTKKMLTTNKEITMTVENIGNDLDFTQIVSRDILDKSSQEIISEIGKMALRLIERTQMDLSTIHAVEIVGGCTRMPAVKEEIKRIFSCPIRTSLNNEEAVSRGCAIVSAIRNPTIKVRDYKITDRVGCSVWFKWEEPNSTKEGSVCIFDKDAEIPSSRLVSLKRKSSFTVFAERDENGEPRRILEIKTSDLNEESDVKVKIKTKMGLDGILTVQEVYMLEEIEPEAEDEEKKSRKVGLSFSSISNGTTKEVLEEWIEQELEMYEDDRLVEMTERERNSLESTVYKIKEIISESNGRYSTNEEKARLEKKSIDTEEWLYSDDGFTAKKSVYEKRKIDLNKEIETITQRIKSEEEREKEILKITKSSEVWIKAAETTELKYSHITAEERNQIVEECKRQRATLESLLEKQRNLMPWDKPALTANEIIRMESELNQKCNLIMNRPVEKKDEEMEVDNKEEIFRDKEKEQQPESMETEDKSR